ncbi:MAG TPA: hypothetical protein VIJ41_16005 [Candidatus Nanopelagicales bacterium]
MSTGRSVRIAASAACLAVLAGSASTQGTVTGVARKQGGFSSFHDGEPMPGQDFVIEDAQRTRMTVTADSSGSFSVSLAPGKYTLMCGGRPQFTVVAGQVVELDCGYQMV